MTKNGRPVESSSMEADDDPLAFYRFGESRSWQTSCHHLLIQTIGSTTELLLVDTHIVVWLAQQPEKLSRRANKSLAKARVNENGLAVSTTSLSELAWLAAAGKLRFDPPVEFSRKDRAGESCLSSDRRITLGGVMFLPLFPATRLSGRSLPTQSYTTSNW